MWYILSMIIKPDFVTIDRYLPPRERHLKDMRNKRVKDVIYILICSFILTSLFHKAVSSIKVTWVKTAQAATVPTSTPTPHIIKKEAPIREYVKDIRVQKLETFLTSKSSPFASMASYIVQESDKAGIDWTLLSSISGKESSYGVAGRCYNAWGLGGTHFMCFKSWNDSIAYEANLLGADYRANSVRGIQNKYCPDYECASDWTDFVVGASQDILAVNLK